MPVFCVLLHRWQSFVHSANKRSLAASRKLNRWQSFVHSTNKRSLAASRKLSASHPR